MKLTSIIYIKKCLTWVSRRISLSADILGSIPTEQCLAIARLSSDCTVNGGSIPVFIIYI
jgi:hypothetical protein